MSRRSDLLQQLIKSDKWGEEKTQEQKFLAATAELILTDLINIAMNGVEKSGAGSLIINSQNDSTTYMSGTDIEYDIGQVVRSEYEEIITVLRGLMEEIDDNDWSKNVLITLISDAGTRTFAVEAGGSQESFRAITAEFTD